MSVSDWYKISNEADVDSPTLLVYPERIKYNIDQVIASIGDVTRLRPHIKTHKSPQVCRMMIDSGISKFKCATISEAEMLAAAGASDILVAYQPVGPKVKRLVELTDEFPQTSFSCLVDNLESASAISSEFLKSNKTIQVYIDLNVGMNRTGIKPADALELIEKCSFIKGIIVRGLHAYDGHLRDQDYTVRKKRCDEAFNDVVRIQREVQARSGQKLIIVAGGTPTYSIHSKRSEIECSPGTFVYWDRGYEQGLPEQRYQFAAVVLCRVISLPDKNTICIDLGHKAIASENPLNQRVHFLNATGLEPAGHSEEHMVFKTDTKFRVGDVLYGIPYHICPTVALHDQVGVVENRIVTDHWHNISRNRKITI